jgi:hypothetical protein
MSVPNTTPVKPSTSVREVETVDGAVLLDIRQGLCLGMTPISVKVWHLLQLNYSLDQITDSLAAEFHDVEREQIRTDVVEFITDLERNNLFHAEPEQTYDSLAVALFFFFFRSGDHSTSPNSSALPRFLLLQALLMLLTFDICRFGNNFFNIYRAVKSFPCANRDAPPETVEKICKAVRHACAVYPKRVLCLQRSLVTTCLARKFGVAAEMVIGVQKMPLRSHAWTEVNGAPINEGRDVQSIYLLWDRC